MGSVFNSIHFNAISRPDKDVEAAGARPMAMRGAADPPVPQAAAPALMNEESAARFYLNNILHTDARPPVRGLTAPLDPRVVPDLKVLDTKTSDLTKNSVVRFVQTKNDVPIFGSHAIVELDPGRELVGVDAQLTQVGNIPGLAALSPAQAFEKIVELTEPDKPIDLGALKSPALMYFHGEQASKVEQADIKWHLVWHFKNVPAAPKKYLAGLRSHGPLKALPPLNLSLDYLVDAHDGSIVLYWSSSPRMAEPVECTGTDECDQQRTFLGEPGPAQNFILSDPLAKIKTFDLGLGDIAVAARPPLPFASATSAFNGRGAVSAHFNAGLVLDFLQSVLRRNSIDDAGMELRSYVNCTYVAHQPGPEWKNAVWNQGQMWYGQVMVDGELRSLARHLDVMAHELAHGITEHTANLMYYKQSGALNESFSDIFGLIIKNWDFGDPDKNGGSVEGWEWEIGVGLGPDGLPLRDMRDPARTGDPAHMCQFLDTEDDDGGVHTNSNIHNKAAYNVLTAKGENGKYLFTPRNVALLYYRTLSRLGATATFQETLGALLNVAEIMFSGSPNGAARLAAIQKAYSDVGIQKP